MATRAEVFEKAERQGFKPMSRKNAVSNRVDYKFFAGTDTALFFDKKTHIHACVGARAALIWLKQRREENEQSRIAR